MDFSRATHTAILSDLHLCEAEPVNPKYPLWKKFKTRMFFFDGVFADFLSHLEDKAGGAPIELILNGDIFDFDSVMALPEEPVFRLSWLEKKRGLFPRSERSSFKIKVILKDHPLFVEALRNFIARGHRVVFVIGNHDLELHFPAVQQEILRHLSLTPEAQDRVRFIDWFYISNQDTLIEHGNQYDPYCVCEDPLNPFTKGYNHVSLKLPFGNLACRYIMNGMGFFNPHVDSNYIMGLREYVTIFLRYMARAQPLLIFSWFGGSVATLGHSFKDRLVAPIRNPLKIEDRVEDIARRANAEPRMVRELRELFAAPASSNPWLLMRELWLDRALLIFAAFVVIFQLFSSIRAVYSISFFWMFIPLFLFLPFFLFYSRSVTSLVSGYKEPDEKILAMASAITRVSRIVFGHTHHARHEMIGAVEHLNSGCWSPAFLDIECTKPIDQKTYVWISPAEGGPRQAELLQFSEGTSRALNVTEREGRRAALSKS
ncbi:MAG: metallophosphoesterase [Bdellovibrionaceae bacterium]|nr:metallophosphoesterase [Pseudobdellovibrionaceae bacterium]MBX3033698.1 metallophosphoesterase [Pseudobdellovibrionaceae bacterium]